MKQCKSWPLMPFCTCLCSIFLNTTKTLPHANFQWEAAAFCSLLYQSEEALSFKNVQHHRLKYYLDNIVRNFSWMTWQNTSIRSRLIRTSHTVKQKRSDAKHENCANRFPFFCILSHPIFSSVDRWLRKSGSFAISNHNARCLQNARTPEMEERVFTRFEAIPSTSTRAVACKIGISQPVVWCITHEKRMPPNNAKSEIFAYS